MNRKSVFLDSFLDGFTMAGFLRRVRMPGEPMRIFAASGTVERSLFAPDADNIDLRQVSQSELDRMMELLRREDEDRKLAGGHAKEAGHAAAR